MLLSAGTNPRLGRSRNIAGPDGARAETDVEMEAEMDEDRSAPEPRVVNVAEPWERAYWARRFMVPVEKVQAAVEAVGSDPATVAAHLGRDWPGHEAIV